MSADLLACLTDPEEAGRAALSRYTLVRALGAGAFADVSLFRDARAGGRLVAIKAVRRAARAGGVNLGALRELAAFAEVPRHPNVLALLDAFSFAGRAHLVLEYAVADLAAVARAGGPGGVRLTEADARGYAAQLFAGLAAVHAAGLIHADLKPDNVLVAPGGVVKVADFGHAGPPPAPGRPRHHRVVTVWYRAPELLAGARVYTSAVDAWAAGCILAELLLRAPLFPARGDAGTSDGEWERLQAAAIVRLLGTPVDPLAQGAGVGAGAGGAGAGGAGAGAGGKRPAPPLPPPPGGAWRDEAWSAGRAAAASAAAAAAGATGGAAAAAPPPPPPPGTPARQLWPGCSSLPSFASFEPRAPQPWRSILPPGAASDAAVDLVSRLVCYDPARRLSAAEALEHAFFTDPRARATPPRRLPLPPAALAAAAEAEAAARA